MGVFGPKPAFRGASGMERMAAAMDMPFSFGQAFGENFSQGITDSFGLGTAIRELGTPSLLSDRPFRGETQENFDARRARFEAQTMSEDEYKSSPFFREAVPYQPGMTPDRAAALAKSTDTRAVRQYFSQKQPIAAFLGQFGGQALDPINYVPVFGQGAQLAAVARFGSIGGRALMSASEAAINTAAFGILTAGVRSRLGDDVSFEMIGTEIAMSALIGGAFGGGIGMLVRGRDARERVALGQARNALSTAANRQKAAIALNEQIDALATTGNPAATPNGMASIETVHTEVQRRVTAARSLDEQTAGVTGTKAGEVVIAPSGRRVSVVPEVVELDSLIHAEGALQVRNRRTAASDAQIEEIGATLDPARMMPNIDGSQGAPLVGADHIIDSGNGRVAGVRRAYEAYPEKAEAYRAFLAEQGYNVEGMQRPVLINRRVTNLDETARAQFNAELNGRTTASLGAVEIAQMDRAAMTDNVLDAHAPAPVTAASNRAFVQRFMAQLPANDRQALLSADGKALSAEGVRRIENALFASAYGDIDPSAVRRFAEGVDDNTRSIVGAMSDMAGAWAKMRRDAKAGMIPQHLDQTKELTDALRLIGMWREQAAREGRPVSKVISEGMAQMDLLTGEIRPETQVFIRSFYTSDAFARAQGREALAGQFADLIESGYELGRPSLFGDAMPEVSALQVLENAVRRNAETDPRPTGDALSRAEENGSADIEPAPGADRGLDRQSDEAGAEALAEADIFSHGADLGERPMSSADIADAMRERFENAGRPADEAEAAAGMLSTFYSTMAARTGRSINDLLKIAPLPEVRRGGQPDMSAQALAQQGVELGDISDDDLLKALTTGSADVESAAFKKWFKDSKITDDEGRPQVVYHNGHMDLDAFDRMQSANRFGISFNNLGIWFSNRSDAKGGAGMYGPKQYPVYLSMQKPLVIHGHETRDMAFSGGTDAAFRKFWKLYDKLTDEASSPAVSKSGFPIRAEQRLARRDPEPMRQWLKENGYDGVILRNTFGDTPAGEAAGQDMFIALEPEQIKSTENRGTFDPSDPRILYQPAWHGTPHIFDKFSSDKIGTGEGAQAFGYGLYFAGKKDVAEHYRRTLAGEHITLDGTPVDDGWFATADADALRAMEVVIGQGGDVAKAQARLDEWATGSNPAQAKRNAGPAKWLKENAASIKIDKKGRLFKVDVPADDELMAWDAPLSEQSAAVKKAINEIGRKYLLPEVMIDGKTMLSWEMENGFGRAPDVALEQLRSLLIQTRGDAKAAVRRFKDEAPVWLENETRRAGVFDALESAGEVRLEQFDVDAGVGFEKLTGKEFYDRLIDELPKGGSRGRDVRASMLLAEAGVPGHRYLDGGSRGNGEGSYNYVIYDDSRVSVLEYEQGARGSIEFGSDGRSVMSMFDAADASTALHESAHWFLQMFRSFADRADAPAEIRADWDRVRAWWTENADAVAADSPTGATGDDVRRLMETGTSGNRLVDIGIEVGMQEQWARGFEAYLREGVAPNEGLRGIFDQFKRWLTSIYRQALDLNVNINDDIRGVFDRLLAQQQGDLVPNSTAPKPDPVPDGLDAAAAAVRTPADPLKLGAQYGLDDAGGFAEQADIDALKASDMLTPEDQAMLDEADQLVADAEAYGKTLETAAWCMR